MTDKHWFDADWEAYRRGVDDGTIVFDADTMDRPYYRHLVPCAVCGRTQAESTAHRSMDRLEFPAIQIVTPTEEEPSADDATHARLKSALDRVETAMYEFEDAERSGTLHRRTGRLEKTVVSEGVWTALAAVRELLTVVRSRL